MEHRGKIQYKILKLPISGETVIVPKDVEIFLNGYKPDIGGVCRIVTSEFHETVRGEKINSPMEVSIETGIKRTGIPFLDLYTEAHEEGHLLHALSMFKEGKLKEFASNEYEEEMSTDTIAVLSLIKLGYPTELSFSLLAATRGLNYCSELASRIKKFDYSTLF